MNNLDPKIQERLLKLARIRTVPFCYSCYREVPTGICSVCLSDDLMVCLPESGVEYGLTWVIEQLVKDNLTPIDVDQAFEDSVSQSVPETTTLGWMQVDTIRAMKDYDPLSWKIAQSEWEGQEESEGLIVSFDHGTTYFYTSDIEHYLDEEESKVDVYCDEAIQSSAAE